MGNVTTLRFSKPPSANELFFTDWKTKRRPKSKKYNAWLDLAMAEVATQPRHQHEGKVSVWYNVRRTSAVADIGNMEKPISDMLVKMGVIKDDRFIEAIHIQWVGEIDGVWAVVRDV